jgi:hypothetical protein
MDIIEYSTDQERIRAGYERNQIHSKVATKVGDIAKIHSRISERKPLADGHFQLLLVVLQMVVSDILHEDAELRFLLKRFGGE